MDRRTFLTLIAATTSAPVAALAQTKDYTPGMVKEHLAAGATVVVGFNTDWCSTCDAQKRVIKALKAQNPAYEEKLVFIDVDWDKYRRADISKELRVPRRSTLIALHGDQELGRIIAQISETKIKALLDTALNAATA